ncbi:5-(carboxyamino)imidazole ribonucleotide mutase, partial [Clostridium perfringens]
MKVAIFFGSKSDTDVMKGAANCLREFGVEFKAYVLS